MRTALLLGPLLLLPACAGTPRESDVAVPSADARTELVVSFRADPKVAPSVTTLRCDPPDGEHPDPTKACADLAAELDPFHSVSADSLCTEIFGGPQTATVRGTYRGRDVVLDLSRTDGCTTAQWDRLGALLPPVIGAS